MKRLFTFLLIVFACITANAEMITEQQALQKAQQFMPNKELRIASPLLVRQKNPKTTISEVGYYVFNAENNGGFVIVAANDNIPEILGYSDTGYLNPETAPDNVKWLLNLYSSASGVKSTVSNKARRQTRASKPTISPLISTRWNQGAPYNSACPQINGNNCLTGCVATALAQVINYNRWPEGMTSSVPEYITQRNQLHLPSLEPTSFNWSDMTTSDIARLMLYCGQAVKMDYGLDGSGAIPDEEVTALRRVFSYSRTTRFVYRNKYKEADWEELLYTELSENRPVIYNGYTEGNKEGHTFIVHGYEDGRFYINWGWGGQADGYFQLTNLNTDVGAYNFSQCATIGIQPNTIDPVETANVEVTYFSVSDGRYFTYDESGQIYIWVSGNLMRVSNENNTYQIGVGLYDADNKLRKVLWEGQQEFTSNDNYWFSENVSIGKELEQGSYSILLISRAGESENWEPDRGSYEYYGELAVMDNVVKLRGFPLNEDEEKTVDVGVKTIDGITYDLYSLRGKNKALVLPSQVGKYKGELYLPDSVNYEGQNYRLYEAINYSISGSPELTSLSTSMYFFPSVWGCDAVSKYEIREGVVRVNSEISGQLLDKIEFPKSVNYVGGGGVGWSQNVKSIRFNSISRITMSYYPMWQTESMPSLKDVYFMSDEPPLIEWKENGFVTNENVTIHIPKGSLNNWKQSDWRDWKFVEDQETSFAGIELGYNNSDELDGEVAPFDLGDNDAEYAIRLSSEMLKNYIGNYIDGMKFNTCYWGYDYMFITTKDKDYLVKQPLDIDARNWDWNTVSLEKPFEITGEELYIGLGRYNSITTRFSTADEPNPDGFYMRAMGSGAGVNKVFLGNFVNMTEDFRGPLPLRVIVTGDKIPTDIQLSDIKIATEDKIVFAAKVTNKSSKDIKKYTLRFSFDGKDRFDKVIETDLHAGKSEKLNIELADGIGGHHHNVEYSVVDIDGETDINTENSSGIVSFLIPAKTYFPRKIVMEEGTGTWCGYCVRGIESIEKLKEMYPDNFIAIALHNGDEMSDHDNYSAIERQFRSYPSCIINRLSYQDPSYPEIIPIIERDRDNADVKISASALYASKDSSSVAVTTKTVFGYSDTNMPDYRIAYVVVEDNVGPFVQSNFYSGMDLDENDYMYEWSQKPGRVKIEFNDVARGIYGGVNGVQGSVPTSVTEGETYPYSFSFNLPKNIQNKKNIRIVTLLIDNSSGEILNADQSAVVYDYNIDKYTYGFSYNKEDLPGNGIVVIEAEEDDWGDGMVCETNPSADPKNGLILSTFNNSQKTGKAKLEIISNSLDAKLIQWCMGGECVPMNDKTVLEKTFTTDKDGIALVQFDATGIQSKGLLEAVLTTTIDNETHSVKIRFEYSNPVQEPSSMSYLETQLLTNKKYTSSDFSDIKSGSFKISKDGKTIEFKNLDLNCPVTEGWLFKFDKDATIKLSGVNKVFTQAHVAVNPIGALTITGSGSLTTKTTWFDFWVHGTDLTIDNTTLICEGYTAIGNNMSPSGDNIVVKNSTFKGGELFRLSSLVLINSDFVSTRKIVFDPEEIIGSQLKYEDGTRVSRFDIEPVEGDYTNRVTPVAFGDLYFEKNKSRTVNISVQNNGSAPVTKVSYVIEIDGVAETENTYYLPEAVNRIGATFDLPITITGDYKAGIRNVKLTITKVNGSENSSPDKTVSGRFITVSSASSHRVVVEEFTGSWCGWCTRGIVGLDMINNTFGEQVITVAAHSNDPMFAKDYNFIFNLTNGYPSCVINRGELMDPYWGTSEKTPFGIETDILQVLSIPVVGSIDVQAEWGDYNKSSIKMKTKTTFGVDDSSSQFQIGFLLLADGLKGSGSDWAQNNIYAGSNSGDANLRVIENMPAMITNMEYNHVAIAAWGADKGLSGSVSVPIHADIPQKFKYERSISDNSLVQNKDNLSVVALLLDKNTGKIINAAKCRIEAYGTGIVNLKADNEKGDVYDLSGRKVKDNSDSLKDLPKGIYIVNGKKVVVK